ncbi:hypothetical protein LTR65_008961 [Meristemomyces frigidus]
MCPRETVESLERGLKELEGEEEDYLEQVDDLEASDSGHARTIRHLKRKLQQTQTATEHHRSVLTAAQDKWYVGMRRLGIQEAEVLTTIVALSAQRGRERMQIDLDELERDLFALDQALPDEQRGRDLARNCGSVGEQDEEPRNEPKGQSEDTYSETHKQEQDPRDQTFRDREKAIVDYWQTWTDFDKHRSSYRQLLNMHQNGEDPGLDNWSPEWTREEFEVAFLLEGSRLSQSIDIAERCMDGWIKLATMTGMAPLPDQSRDFYQPGSFVYPASFEQEMIDAAPTDGIYQWGEGLPSDAVDFASEHAISESSYTEGVLENVGDVQPGDSVSCAAMDERDRKRLDAFGTGKPEAWSGSAGTRRPE